MRKEGSKIRGGGDTKLPAAEETHYRGRAPRLYRYYESCAITRVTESFVRVVEQGEHTIWLVEHREDKYDWWVKILKHKECPRGTVPNYLVPSGVPLVSWRDESDWFMVGVVMEGCWIEVVPSSVRMPFRPAVTRRAKDCRVGLINRIARRERETIRREAMNQGLSICVRVVTYRIYRVVRKRVTPPWYWGRRILIHPWL